MEILAKLNGEEIVENLDDYLDGYLLLNDGLIHVILNTVLLSNFQQLVSYYTIVIHQDPETLDGGKKYTT